MVFGREELFNLNVGNISALKSSGFTTVVLFVVDVAANGDLNYNGDHLIVTNGVYIGDPGWGGRLAALKQAPTSINRIEACTGGAGAQSWNNIKNLIATQGTNSSSILYRNFLALKNALGIEAICNDDEVAYDAGSAATFNNMITSLGMKNTLAPYNNMTYWQSIFLNSSIDQVYLQCYDGGAFNDPSTWDALFGGFKVTPGDWNNDSPATVQSKFTTWAPLSNGGFMWQLELIGDGNLASYATAIERGLNPLVTTPATGFDAIATYHLQALPMNTSFTLSNASVGPISWSINNTSSWLNVSSNSGVLLGGTATTTTVSVNISVATNLAQGVYAASVIISNQTGGIAASRNFTLFSLTGVSSAVALYVDLRASDLASGAIVWTNRASSGNFTNDGTGVPIYTTNAGVSAVLLNGANEYKGPTASLLAGSAPRTIEVWVNNPSVSDEETIVALGRRGNTDYNFAFNYGSNGGWGGLAMWADDMGWNGIPTANAWHHLVVTADGTNILLYADGALKNSAIKTPTTPVGPIWIGSQTADFINPKSGWFSGYLNSVRIYTGVLSSNAVAANYALGPMTTAVPSSPIGLTGTAANRWISLTWGAVSGATGYNLWRSTNYSGTYQTIATGLSTISYVDTNAVNGQTNYYEVAAVNSNGTSTNSAAVGVFLPGPAINLSANGKALSMSWPDWAADWDLYSTTNLTPPAVWSAVTNAVAKTNGQFTVTLPIGTGVQFFRLVRP